MEPTAEVATPVSLCAVDGRLNRAAVGWSRRPLTTCNLAGHWPRKKRWHHWGVLDAEQYLTITCADVDLFSVAAVMSIDLVSGERRRRVGVARGGCGRDWPEVPGGGAVRFAAQGLSVELVDELGLTRLAASWRRFRAEVSVTRPPAHETLNVVVPRGDDRFMYTSKQMALPASGEVSWGGRSRRFGAGAFAALDYARGVAANRIDWHWACAAGAAGPRAVGVNLGAGWTDGTGTTENALLVDGVLQKLHGDVGFARDPAAPGAWRIQGPRVDLRFTPRRRERPGANLGVFAATLDHGIGAFEGTVVADDGSALAVELSGWCEQVHIG